MKGGKIFSGLQGNVGRPAAGFNEQVRGEDGGRAGRLWANANL